MEIKIEIQGRTVCLNAIGNDLCLGVLYLYIHTVLRVHRFSGSVSVPNGGVSVKIILGSLAASVSVNPLDQFILMIKTEVIVPDVNYLLKRTVCSVLIQLEINVVQKNVVSGGNNYIVPINAIGEYVLIGEKASVSQLLAKKLRGPVQLRTFRFSVT